MRIYLSQRHDDRKNNGSKMGYRIKNEQLSDR